MKKQQGFTLIELIMVIVILGILSAFALPRFADLSGQAEISALNGGTGAVKSSAAIVHAFCLASPTACATSPVTMDGVDIAINTTTNYPAASAAGIGAAASLDGFGYGTPTAIAGPPAGNSIVMTLTKNTACEITYNDTNGTASDDDCA